MTRRNRNANVAPAAAPPEIPAGAQATPTGTQPGHTLTPAFARNDVRPTFTPAHPTAGQATPPAPAANPTPAKVRPLNERTFSALIRYLSNDLRAFADGIVKDPKGVRLEQFIPDLEGKLRTVHTVASALGKVNDETLPKIIPVPTRAAGGLSTDTIAKILELRKAGQGKAAIAKAVSKRPHVIIEVFKTHGDPGPAELHEKERIARQKWIDSMKKRIETAESNS